MAFKVRWPRRVSFLPAPRFVCAGNIEYPQQQVFEGPAAYAAHFEDVQPNYRAASYRSTLFRAAPGRWCSCGRAPAEMAQSPEDWKARSCRSDGTAHDGGEGNRDRFVFDLGIS